MPSQNEKNTENDPNGWQYLAAQVRAGLIVLMTFVSSIWITEHFGDKAGGFTLVGLLTANIVLFTGRL